MIIKSRDRFWPCYSNPRENRTSEDVFLSPLNRGNKAPNLLADCRGAEFSHATENSSRDRMKRVDSCPRDGGVSRIEGSWYLRKGTDRAKKKRIHRHPWLGAFFLGPEGRSCNDAVNPLSVVTAVLRSQRFFQSGRRETNGNISRTLNDTVLFVIDLLRRTR